MSKDGKGIIEKIIGKIVELKPSKHYDAPEIAPVNKKLKDSRVALVSTAGVHLKEDEPFDTRGSDPSYRVVPSNSKMEDLMITHGHYDDSQAHLDINVVFPIDRLLELKEEGVIGSLADNFYTFRGYIPKTRPLIKKSAPEVAKLLVKDRVDIAILTPG